MKEKDADKPGIVYKISEFIVDKRNWIFLIYILVIIFCLVSRNWVKIENDLTAFLPADTETRQGIELMEKEFTTYASAEIMISNISYKKAETLAEEIKNIEGVKSVSFENTDKHFKNASAMLSVTFDYTTDDERAGECLKVIKEKLQPYDIYVSSDVGNSVNDSLASEMSIIVLIAAVIIGIVLTLTSKSYFEVPVLAITFIVAALLNMGTNFMLGKISFISNSIAVILQLALAIDYAIILCHRYTEEREHFNQREAVITALSKSIPEVSSSSLTTISGLAALMVMEFKIGQDMAIVLIKAILLSLLSVFTLMPGLLMLFANKMEKTQHKNYIPKITAIGKFDIKTKKIIPPIFLGFMILGFIFSSLCPYCFGQSDLSTLRKSETQIASDKIKNNFKQTNLVALVVPSGDYEKEAALLSEIEQYDEVDHTQGLANTEAMQGYMLTDALNARELSELTEVDYEVSKLLYAAYAANQKDYGKIVSKLDTYSVPLIDMLEFLHDELDKGFVSLDDETTDALNEIYSAITDGKKQLESNSYSRLLVFLDMPEEGEETFAFLDTLHSIMNKYYPTDTYIVGNSTSDYDLSSSFSRDNILIAILSVVFVILILFFTFKSAALPIMLIAVIQGSIWINFSFPFIFDKKLFFLGYLIVSSIQMGANIDYAIVISNRFNELKKAMNISDAMIETLNQAFPTIFTSGSILASAAFLIAFISTNGVIVSIGECLGRGTLISMFLVLCVLPQILLIGNKLCEKTAFTINKADITHDKTGKMYVNGHVRGKISGIVDADIHGVIVGNVNANVNSEKLHQIADDKLLTQGDVYIEDEE